MHGKQHVVHNQLKLRTREGKAGEGKVEREYLVRILERSRPEGEREKDKGGFLCKAR